MTAPAQSVPDYSAASAAAPFAAARAPIPAWATVGAPSAVAASPPPPKNWLQKAAFGALKIAAIGSVFGAIFFAASAWGLQRDIKAVQEGRIDLSEQAVRSRKTSGASPLPLDADDFSRYAEATLYSGLAYKKDWKAEVAAGSCHEAIRPVAFFPDNFGAFENKASAMRVFSSAPPDRCLVVSFSGSDDWRDFVRDSNGFGVLSSMVSPRTSFQELETGVLRALEVIGESHEGYERIIIAGHSLGGHLANEFAHRLARAHGHDVSSNVLAKTELLTLNTLYLGSPEPLCLGRVSHFRESLELTDHIGKLSGLRAPTPAFVRQVSSRPVADGALQEQLRLQKKISENFSPLDVFRQIRIIFSYGVERMENMVGRHMGRTAELRVHDAIERSAFLADASANAAERAAHPAADFAAAPSEAWGRASYGCNTLREPRRAHAFAAARAVLAAWAPAAQLPSVALDKAPARRPAALPQAAALAGAQGFAASLAARRAAHAALASLASPALDASKPSRPRA